MTPVHRRRWEPWTIAAFGLATVIALIVTEALPLNRIPGWFYRPGPKTLGRLEVAIPVLALGLAGLTVAAWTQLRAAGSTHRRSVAALIVAGLCFHTGINWIDDQGIDTMLERVGAGHGEFMRVAEAHREHPLEVLRQYEQFAADGRLREYARSKPPGTLAAYFAMDAIAQTDPMLSLLTPIREQARAHDRTQDIPAGASFALVLFALGTVLCLLPLQSLARTLFHHRSVGIEAGALVVTSPAFMLIGFHLDNALFPALALGTAALAAKGAKRDHIGFSLAGGALGGFACYFTFGMLAALGLGVAMILLVAFGHLMVPDQHAQRRGWGILLRHGLGFVLGAGAAIGALMLLLHFDPIAGYERSMAFHTTWKAYVPTAFWRWMGIGEFLIHAGLPLALVFVWDAGRSAATFLSRLRGTLRPITGALFALGIAATLLLLGRVAGTNEVARLWLFMLPFVALAIAATHRERADAQGHSSSPKTIWVLAGAQFCVAVAMKLTFPW